MLNLLCSWFRAAPVAAPTTTATLSAAPPPPAEWVTAPGVADFDVAAHLVETHGLVVLDWSAAQQWVDSIGAGDAAQAQAWSDCEHAWLAHLRAALGAHYRLTQNQDSVLLSSLEPAVAQATLAFVDKTRQRVLKVLDGIAEVQPWGLDILVIFDDEDSYYSYVAHCYPEAGEFAGSGGMYINHGCGHFVTVKNDLRLIEPVIAHEITHACLAHLPLPAWLNEGLAVNTEQRLCPPPAAGIGQGPQQMHARHQRFWGAVEIQEFWSGQSFLRADEGNELSYDLARILVAQFAADWPRFQAFALAASLEDGGAAAALQHLGLELAAAAAAVLQAQPGPAWAPDPGQWTARPEPGAF